MPEEARRRDQLIGVFALAVILFNPPLLDLFGGTVFGWPLLYVYLFGAWCAVIAVIAIVTERRHRHDRIDSED